MIASVVERIRGGHSSSVVGPELEHKDLRRVASAKNLVHAIQKEKLDPDLLFQDGDALIHYFIKRKDITHQKRQKLLLALLTYSCADVDNKSASGMTALHVAALECDYTAVRVLVAFGASINMVNAQGRTALDILGADSSEFESAVMPSPPSSSRRHSSSSSPRHKPLASLSGNPSANHALTTAETRLRLKLRTFLESAGAVRGSVSHLTTLPSVQRFSQVLVPAFNPYSSEDVNDPKIQQEIIAWQRQLTQRYSELHQSIHQRTSNKIQFSADEAMSLALQLREMQQFQKAGSRILCLDGGGIRGLVQLEILGEIERLSGRRITELFDWIIGTSTGGVIALGMVYGNKSIAQLRQLYFRMKDEIFSHPRGGVTFDTDALEKILKEELTDYKCMDDESYPRVLIPAVKKEHINLKVHFFNNCFQDEFCKHWPVWKVARYTSAAPVLFGECEDYVDGGVLANNPCERGLTKIQEYYRMRGEKLPISLVVSVGCGKAPVKKLGNIDAQDFLSLSSWFDSSAALRDRTKNLLTLFTTAMVETEGATVSCQSRCKEQNIHFFRLNPRLLEVVDSGETDSSTLVSMILQTRKEITERQELADLILTLHDLSIAGQQTQSSFLQSVSYHTTTLTGSHF